MQAHPRNNTTDDEREFTVLYGVLGGVVHNRSVRSSGSACLAHSVHQGYFFENVFGSRDRAFVVAYIRALAGRNTAGPSEWSDTCASEHHLIFQTKAWLVHNGSAMGVLFSSVLVLTTPTNVLGWY
jgi:hypothetical protein